MVHHRNDVRHTLARSGPCGENVGLLFLADPDGLLLMQMKPEGISDGITF